MGQKLFATQTLPTHNFPRLKWTPTRYIFSGIQGTLYKIGYSNPVSHANLENRLYECLSPAYNSQTTHLGLKCQTTFLYITLLLLNNSIAIPSLSPPSTQFPNSTRRFSATLNFGTKTTITIEFPMADYILPPSFIPFY